MLMLGVLSFPAELILLDPFHEDRVFDLREVMRRQGFLLTGAFD